MTLSRHLMLFAVYAGLALAIGALAPILVPSVGAAEAFAFAGFILLVGILLHEIVARLDREAWLLDQIGQLRRTSAETARELRRVRNETDLFSAALETAATSPRRDVGDVVAEVKVLQSLIHQLYANRTVPALQDVPAPPPTELPLPASDVEPTVDAPPDAEASAVLGPAPSGDPSPEVELAPAIDIPPIGAAAVGEPPPAELPPEPDPRPRRRPPPPPEPAQSTGGPTLPMPPIAEHLDDEAVLDLLRDGLHADRVDLALQPIVSLPQRKRRYYECFSRVHAGDGTVIVPEQYIELAERAGLVAAIDNMLLFRCIQLLRRIRPLNPNVAFFCNISHHTLADRAFFRDFVSFMRENAELAQSIIFEFPQRAVATQDAAAQRDLDSLATLGFRCSLDQVGDLDLDVDDLAARHFRFVKIEAARLLQRPAGVGVAGLKHALDTCGLDLIVEKIESEAILVELLDLNIDFGQGYLFGEPRLSPSEAAA